MRYLTLVLIGVLMTPVSALIGVGVLCVFIPLLPFAFVHNFLPWFLAFAWAAPGTIIVFPVLKLLFERNAHLSRATFRWTSGFWGAAAGVLPLIVPPLNHLSGGLHWMMIPMFAQFALSGFVSGYLTSALYLCLPCKLKKTG